MILDDNQHIDEDFYNDMLDIFIEYPMLTKVFKLGWVSKKLAMDMLEIGKDEMYDLYVRLAKLEAIRVNASTFRATKDTLFVITRMQQDEQGTV